MRAATGKQMVLDAIAGFCKNHPGCDCMAGGCEELANALVTYVGAEKQSVTAYDGEIVHFVAVVDGLAYDGLGAATLDDIAEEWAFDRSADCVKIAKA